ncbi:MAG: TIGR02444 family protein [Alphaproteobacteria bacterium]
MDDPAPWAFSLHVHAAPGVERFCLSLQDGLRADVTLLLCAAWCGATGRGALGEADLARLDAAIAPLRDEVVARLRAARRWLKPVAATSPRIAAMRERIKAIELESEREVQFLLADALEATHPRPAAPPGRAKMPQVRVDVRARGKRLDRKQLRRMGCRAHVAPQHAHLWRRRFPGA